MEHELYIKDIIVADIPDISKRMSDWFDLDYNEVKLFWDVIDGGWNYRVRTVVPPSISTYVETEELSRDG